MIDWAATGSMIGGLAAWAGVGAVAYAANRAANTVDGFRKEKLFERRLETADDVLTLAYRIKRNLAAVRSPMSSGNEHEAAHEILKEYEWYQNLLEEQELRQAQQGQLIRMRLKRYNADWERIFEVMPKARAYFGEEVEVQLQKLCEQVTCVTDSADMYMTDERIYADFSTELKQDIWDKGLKDPKKNRVGVAIEEAIDVLEKILLPILRDPSLGA